MIAIIVYILLVGVGEVIAFFVAQAFDSLVPAAWSMVFCMTLFFGVIWVMWPVAVFVTERFLVKPEGSVKHSGRHA